MPGWMQSIVNFNPISKVTDVGIRFSRTSLGACSQLYNLIGRLYQFYSMTGDTSSAYSYSKVGPKGQIVISKRLREKYAIQPGKQVEQIETKAGVLIRAAPLLEDWKRLSYKVGRKWPKKVSSVEAIRKEREK